MGRKPLGDEGKTFMMRIRMKEPEHLEIEQAAKLAGKTTSAWSRELLLAAARELLATQPPEKKPKKPPTN